MSRAEEPAAFLPLLPMRIGRRPHDQSFLVEHAKSDVMCRSNLWFWPEIDTCRVMDFVSCQNAAPFRGPSFERSCNHYQMKRWTLLKTGIIHRDMSHDHQWTSGRGSLRTSHRALCSPMGARRGSSPGLISGPPPPLPPPHHPSAPDVRDTHLMIPRRIADYTCVLPTAATRALMGL